MIYVAVLNPRLSVSYPKFIPRVGASRISLEGPERSSQSFQIVAVCCLVHSRSRLSRSLLASSWRDVIASVFLASLFVASLAIWYIAAQSYHQDNQSNFVT
jgi:hypothetical protein